MTSALYPTFARADLAFERGEGVRLFTADGTEYLDFASGIAVNSLGHCHPHLVKALTEQAGRVWHVSNLYQVPGQEELARRLTENSFADAVFFTNSGAEALECAIKTARRYHYASGSPERYRLITFEGAFHGRTLATIAAGGQPKYLEGFGPAVDGFDQVPFDDLDAVRAAIGPQTAGILIEPVQGEGGLRPVPFATMRALRALCDEHGLLLIVDEVQCGVARTGKLFAYEWSGIEPDIMALAKGIGGGFPMGACLATREAVKGMVHGVHGTTFGGNPLAMAVGNAVLDVVLEPGFIDHVREMGLRFRQGLARIADEHPGIIETVRGEGLMMGVKCRVPNKELVAALQAERLLCVGAGDNVVRLMPPLIVEASDIDAALDRIDAACRALEAAAALRRASA
ncbi:acetylornithine aminotransferase [Tepidamorphus gemmatus]|uniref:Acetylornithine aminotransferase n=1 Tax=Tepidamorphus gemmatus TaxID=747076 RepID=A0A4R3MHV1_9HYPH|nr:aspartate aminotransferase family protein [Tepidamorphus gemmatus]TCT13202.1 acetylornithine aminotransferase [Tepidamorphus gemmatus]